MGGLAAPREGVFLYEHVNIDHVAINDAMRWLDSEGIRPSFPIIACLIRKLLQGYPTELITKTTP